MRRATPRTVIVSLLLLCVVVVSLERLAAHSWGWQHDWVMYRLRVPIFSESYQDKVMAVVEREKTNPRPSNVWLGDSLFARFPHDRLGPSNVNLSIDGETIWGMLHRLDRHPSLRIAQRIIINLGHNDLGRSFRIRSIATLYEQLLSSLPDNVPIVVHAVPPVDERFTDQRTNARIHELNLQLQIIAGRHAHVTWLDVSDLLAGPDGNLRREYHTGDGVHFSSLGYSRWIGALQTSLGGVTSSP